MTAGNKNKLKQLNPYMMQVRCWRNLDVYL